MDHSEPLDTQSLFAQAAWVHRLAHSLVADPNAADDLAQETWLTVLESPPRDGASPRGWLATVLRNLRQESHRGESRRRARERSAAKSEAQPDTADVIARAAMHRELVEAVMCLREPFRTTILLRFFDEKPPRDIARELAVPVHTVNSRIQRGLAELRGKLDETRSGDRRAWMVALLPLARRGASSSWASSSVIGAAIVNTKSKIAVAVVLALAGVLGVNYALDSEPEPVRADVEVAAASAPEAEPQQTPLALRVNTEGRSTSHVAEPDATTASTASSAPSALRIRGTVFDAQAVPLAGLDVQFESKAQSDSSAAFTARSERDGRFEMDAPPTRGELAVDHAEYATVMAGLYRPHASIEPVIVVAKTRPLAGRVRDVDGAPLAKAQVHLALDDEFGTRFAHVLDASVERDWNASADEKGAFDLGLVPRIDGSRLVTSLAGYERDVREAPSGSDRALEIVLKRIEVNANALTGDVRLPDGTPAAGARVAFGTSTLTTDETGRFSFDLTEDDADKVVAIRRGYLPAELAASASAPRWPEFVRLRLGASPNALSGRVVDAHGDPRAKIRVWLADPTYFGNVEGSLTHVEHVLGGAPTNAEVAALRSAQGGKYEGPDLFWSYFETDAHGNFRIEGLTAREYSLKAMDPKSLVQIEDGPFAVGSENIELTLDAQSEFHTVSGRVLARGGEPIPGIRITAARRVVKVALDGWSSSRGHTGATTVTDAEGRFELEHVAREGIYLTALGDAILPTWFDFPEKVAGSAASLENIEIHAVRRCHVQVELSDRIARADAFSLLDASGERLSLSIIRGDNDSTSDTVPLIEGRSPVIAVAEDGTTLVLLHGTSEVERHPVTLTPGQLSVVRP
jgi:RNA polymerase sigma-70 factor (ECF subfamily)